MVTRLGNGHWDRKLCSSILTIPAHTRNKRTLFVLSTKHLGTIFSTSLGRKARAAGLSKTVTGVLLRGLKSE